MKVDATKECDGRRAHDGMLDGALRKNTTTGD
jgi:hypothetical protein